MNSLATISIAIVLSHFIFGSTITIYIWLLGLSVILYFHMKGASSIHERLDEIDTRDMEYHDYYEKKVLELEEKIALLKEKNRHS